MRLSLRVALNSALMILGVYLVQQTMSYLRDMVMLGAPGFADYPATVAGFVGPFVLPPLVVFTLVLYLSARPLERTLEALRRGDSLAPELLESTRLRMLRFSGLVLALNLVGFAAGFLILLAARGQLAELLRVERLVVLLSNLSCGVCFASAQNALNDRAFGELRDRLRLREIGARRRQAPTTTRSLVLGLFLALYAVCFLQWNLRDLAAVQGMGAEALRAELSGAVAPGGAAEEYRRLLAERLGSVSSRASLDYPAIPAPWERGSWLGILEGAFLAVAAYLAAVAAFVLAVYYGAQRERLAGISARLREFAAEGGKAEGRIDLRSMDDLGEIGEGVNRLLDGFAALRAGISRAAAQARAAAAETEAALSRAEGDAARAGAALAAREAEIAAQGEGSRAVARALEELRAAAARAGSAAESQRRLVEETSAATEEIAASIGSVAELSARAAALNEALAGRGASGEAAAAETADAIAGIAASANGVLEVLGALGKIASSTNLLAMNAAIEAAHAGAAGAGFAVVADEVRALASDAAARTKDIRRIVAEMRARVERGVAASAASGEAAHGLSGGIEESAAISRDIGGAMREQAAGTRQVADSLTRLVAAGADISAAMEGQEAAVERSSRGIAEALRRLEAEAAASRRQAEDFRSVLAAFAELRRGMDGTLAASEALAAEAGG